MKKRNAAWILMFTGILIMLFYIVFGKAMLMECLRLNGEYAMQKVLVSVKNHLDTNDRNSFSMDDTERLQKELSTNDISFSAHSGLINTSVSDGIDKYSAVITGVNALYSQFNRLTMLRGSFITEIQEEEGAMVTVVSDALAHAIFNTNDVAGKTIEIYGNEFKIIGVVKSEGSILGKLVDDGIPDVFIPAGIMLELDETARISELQVKTEDSSLLDLNKSEISKALKQIGKNPSNYALTDYNLKYALLEQGPRLFVFILGIVSIFALLGYMLTVMKALYKRIKVRYRSEYLLNILKSDFKVLALNVLQIMLALTGSVFIWKGISFKPYIPPQYIADELINISYYANLIEGLIQDLMRNIGFVAPHSLIIVNTVGMLLTLAFLLALVFGLIVLNLGLREMLTKNSNPDRLTIICGLTVVLALIVVILLVLLAGLPFNLDVKSILVFWVFIFLKISLIQGKESANENV